MSISESPYAYLSTSEKEAMVEYHQADQGQQVGITPVVGTFVEFIVIVFPNSIKCLELQLLLTRQCIIYTYDLQYRPVLLTHIFLWPQLRLP
jgi:hypothetical protein